MGQACDPAGQNQRTGRGAQALGAHQGVQATPAHEPSHLQCLCDQAAGAVQDQDLGDAGRLGVEADQGFGRAFIDHADGRDGGAAVLLAKMEAHGLVGAGRRRAVDSVGRRHAR